MQLLGLIWAIFGLPGLIWAGGLRGAMVVLDPENGTSSGTSGRGTHLEEEKLLLALSLRRLMRAKGRVRVLGSGEGQRGLKRYGKIKEGG